MIIPFILLDRSLYPRVADLARLHSACHIGNANPAVSQATLHESLSLHLHPRYMLPLTPEQAAGLWVKLEQKRRLWFPINTVIETPQITDQSGPKADVLLMLQVSHCSPGTQCNTESHVHKSQVVLGNQHDSESQPDSRSHYVPEIQTVSGSQDDTENQDIPSRHSVPWGQNDPVSQHILAKIDVPTGRQDKIKASPILNRNSLVGYIQSWHIGIGL